MPDFDDGYKSLYHAVNFLTFCLPFAPALQLVFEIQERFQNQVHE